MKHWFRTIDRDERGMTIVELMVGMLVLSLIILAAAGWIFRMNKSSQVIETLSETETQADNAFRILQEDFRAGSALIVAGDRLEIQKISGEQIRYFISGNRNLIRSLNGEGASVVAPHVSRWNIRRIGDRGLQVTLVIDREGVEWEKQRIFALRGWTHE